MFRKKFQCKVKKKGGGAGGRGNNFNNSYEMGKSYKIPQKSLLLSTFNPP